MEGFIILLDVAPVRGTRGDKAGSRPGVITVARSFVSIDLATSGGAEEQSVPAEPGRSG